MADIGKPEKRSIPAPVAPPLVGSDSESGSEDGGIVIAPIYTPPGRANKTVPR